MSLIPLKSSKELQSWYGCPAGPASDLVESEQVDETTGLIAVDQNTQDNGQSMQTSTGEVIYELFMQAEADWEDVTVHPKTNPKLPPVKRFKRHRNYHIYHLNQFRHWWKTSRLLVRVSGGYEYCLTEINWVAMGLYKVSKHRQAKKALKSVKGIGRGGPSRDFLSNIKPFTQSIRIILAVARGWEAKVDNRFTEVMLAEAFAFMGNRCSRWIARELVTKMCMYVMFPYVGALLLEPNLEQRSRPIIVMMGFIRAVLPFAFSFQGSRLGRQLTYNTFRYAYFRWRPAQSLAHFHPNAGLFQDTVLDDELQALAHAVAFAIGHGQDPVAARENMAILGFSIVGSGQGGYSVYQKLAKESGKFLLVHLTPYGPSILDEMPRYIVLERKMLRNWAGNSDICILDAALPPEVSVTGFTYSGAFFKSQEWAALTTRFNETLQYYETACQKLGTVEAMKGKNAILTPPTDLATLKAFIRSGHVPKKVRKDTKQWKQLDAEIKTLSCLISEHQKQGSAPKKIIIYLEGLDCSAKSSTGGLIFSALQDCGYTVRTAQHNKPPSKEQQKKSWMDRGRFEYPEDVYNYGEDVPEYTALVWDRGPAGDFVYGKFADLPESEKNERYNEFRSYDARCQEEGVLFCKLLFVADKDSIATTLGKRLAHKKIACDLRTWLDANSIEHARQGLEEIENHIDPTDFVAFNQYKANMSIFTEFARNTDDTREQHVQGVHPGYHNPWTIVNTAKRHPARLALLRTFERHIKRFAEDPKRPPSFMKRVQKRMHVSLPYLRDDAVLRFFREDEIDFELSLRAFIQAIMLVLLFCFYLYTTWKIDIIKVFDDL